MKTSKKLLALFGLFATSISGVFSTHPFRDAKAIEEIKEIRSDYFNLIYAPSPNDYDFIDEVQSTIDIVLPDYETNDPVEYRGTIEVENWKFRGMSTNDTCFYFNYDGDNFDFHVSINFLFKGVGFINTVSLPFFDSNVLGLLDVRITFEEDAQYEFSNDNGNPNDGYIFPSSLGERLSFSNCMDDKGNQNSDVINQRGVNERHITLTYDDNTCIHDWILFEDESFPSTCQEYGCNSYYCANCKIVRQEDLTELGPHEWGQSTIINPGSCTEDGSAKHECINCGEEETYVITASGHNYGNKPVERIEATCTEDGYETYICANCQDEKREVLEATGHVWGEPSITPESCTTDGKSVVTCAKCNATSETVLPAKGHDYGTEIHEIKATCTTDGKTFKVCSTCKEELVLTTNPALGHDFREESVTPATCLEAGIKNLRCSRCQETDEEEIAPLGHNYGDPITVTAATCTQNGTSKVVCSRCNDEVTSVIQASGHIMLEPVTTNATCTEEGKIVTSCAKCDYEEVETLPVLGHSYDNGIRTEPTCTEEGKIVYTCTRCNDKHEEILDPKGHSYDNGTRVEPTCTKEGSITYVCVDCGDVRVESIDKSAHRFKKIEKEASTCAVQGIAEQWQCIDCEKYSLTSDETTIDLSDTIYRLPLDPNNHSNYETYLANRRNPTSTLDGYEGDIMCSMCNAKVGEGNVIPKIHTEDEEEAKQQASENIESILEGEDEEVIQEINEAIENIDTDTLVEISDQVSETANKINEAYEGVEEGERVEIQPGVALTQEEANEVIQSVTKSAVLIAGNKSYSLEETNLTKDNLPDDVNIPLTDIVSNLFDRTIQEILGLDNKDNQRISNNSINGIYIRFANQNNVDVSIDFSISPETYKSAIEFVDVTVTDVNKAARRIRECSNEKYVQHIDSYISGISIKSFRDFDRQKADEEFLEASYEAILITLQTNVLKELENTYNKQKVGKTGVALAELTDTYNKEVELISKLHFTNENTDECDGCFEDIVIDIMRQKYISILENKLSNGEISEATYDSEMLNTISVESFKPIYLRIFRCWALQEEDNTLVKIDLETLSNAMIENSNEKLSDALTPRKTLYPEEIVMFALIGVSLLALVAVAIIPMIKKYRESEVK